MKNNKKTITPSEINKYLYCPYQWYYERYYGTKHIRTLYKERNEKLGLTDTRKSNFNKGLKFEETYYKKDKAKRIVNAMLFVLILLLIIYSYIQR